MGVSVERLRLWLLAGSGLLVLVIAGFLEYAHLRAHRFLKELPGRLGADITRESNGFTLSQSAGGRTVYTIHAARMVQRKDGKTTLHDVGIVLYGQKQDRADRIYGSEFEYDQKAGVVRAVGEVHLDLQAPAPTDTRGRAAYASGHDLSGSHTDDDEQLVHIKTSGLVFVQSLGAASTDQEIEFQFHGMNGHAKGADYSSDTGVTVLQSDVRVSGLRDGAPALLTASRAEMDRNTRQLTLAHARYFAGVDGRETKGDAGRIATAQEVVLHMRDDGSVERVEARGGVGLEEGAGALRGQTASVIVSAANRPEVLHMAGGLTYASTETLRESQGRAEEGTAHFDAGGVIKEVSMEGGAELHVKQRSSAALPWSERTISGKTLEARFATAGKTNWIREGRATGAARMLLLDRVASGGRTEESSSEVRGDVLTAEMQWDGSAARLRHAVGTGHTSLDRRDANGGQDTSRGDTLEVNFASRGAEQKDVPGMSASPDASATSITRAVQSGGVSLTHLPARRAGESAAPLLTSATGTEAVFEEGAETLTIRGETEVKQAGSVLRADTVTLLRSSGDASADGRVAVTYVQSPGANPLHILAARAQMKRDVGHGVFFGAPGAAARLWQGGSQVEAPVIELDQEAKTLVARTSGAQVVRTVLAKAPGGTSGRSQVMRIASRTLRYSDADRRADFGGGVVLEDADGTVRASEVVALLTGGATPADTKAGKGVGGGLLGGTVDRITASGTVEVSEPGRHASGDRLVYTASDGRFVMTGSAGAPPKVVDEVQGTVTGSALEFRTGDNGVMILGEGKAGEGHRVHTETLVRKPS